MSTLRVNNITDASGGSSSLSVPGAAKAWVNFNGTGTVAIRASFNVSSITDNGVGDYTVNFTTALADANYSLVGITGNAGVQSNCSPVGFKDATTAPTASSARIEAATRGYASTDQDRVSVQIFR